MTTTFHPGDTVILTTDLPRHNLKRGERLTVNEQTEGRDGTPVCSVETLPVPRRDEQGVHLYNVSFWCNTAHLAPAPPEDSTPVHLITADNQCTEGDQTETPAKPKRRGALHLRAPRDTRTEEKRMADGLEFLERLGYTCLRVGQGRAAAICHACSRKSRARGGPRWVRIKCNNRNADGSECGSLGYAPSTNSTAGTPDSFVSHKERWAFGESDGICILGTVLVPMLGVEWKDAPNGRRQPEQKVFEADGLIVVAWDTPSLCYHVHRFERAIGVESLADVVKAAGEFEKEREGL